MFQCLTLCNMKSICENIDFLKVWVGRLIELSTGLSFLYWVEALANHITRIFIRSPSFVVLSTKLTNWIRGSTVWYKSTEAQMFGGENVMSIQPWDSHSDRLLCIKDSNVARLYSLLIREGDCSVQSSKDFCEDNKSLQFCQPRHENSGIVWWTTTLYFPR